MRKQETSELERIFGRKPLRLASTVALLGVAGSIYLGIKQSPYVLEREPFFIGVGAAALTLGYGAYKNYRNRRRD